MFKLMSQRYFPLDVTENYIVKVDLLIRFQSTYIMHRFGLKKHHNLAAVLRLDLLGLRGTTAKAAEDKEGRKGRGLMGREARRLGRRRGRSMSPPPLASYFYRLASSFHM